MNAKPSRTIEIEPAHGQLLHRFRRTLLPGQYSYHIGHGIVMDTRLGCFYHLQKDNFHGTDEAQKHCQFRRHVQKTLELNKSAAQDFAKIHDDILGMRQVSALEEWKQLCRNATKTLETYTTVIGQFSDLETKAVLSSDVPEALTPIWIWSSLAPRKEPARVALTKPDPTKHDFEPTFDWKQYSSIGIEVEFCIYSKNVPDKWDKCPKSLQSVWDVVVKTRTLDGVDAKLVLELYRASDVPEIRAMCICTQLPTLIGGCRVLSPCVSR